MDNIADVFIHTSNTCLTQIQATDSEKIKTLLIYMVKNNYPPGIATDLVGRNYLDDAFLTRITQLTEHVVKHQ